MNRLLNEIKALLGRWDELLLSFVDFVLALLQKEEILKSVCSKMAEKDYNSALMAGFSVCLFMLNLSTIFISSPIRFISEKNFTCSEQIREAFEGYFGKDFNVVHHLRNAEAHLASDAGPADAESYRQKVKELTTDRYEKASEYWSVGKNSNNLIGNVPIVKEDPGWQSIPARLTFNGLKHLDLELERR
jgi:hypothetical protein